MPNFARGCPFTCRFCSQWKFWRKYRTRDPKKFVDEIETLVRDYKVGFFILADEEPTINRKKFVAMCEELIARKLPVYWGINTRVTDILRDADLLPLYRKAGLLHISLGTEAAAQMKLDLFRKQTTIEQNKKAIQLIKNAGIVAEAQFIIGLEGETKETIEETYRYALDWNPDMANWNMYTPWPFAELFEELGDRVEVRDYSKYNFVTPIMKPDEMERDDVLKGVLRNYAPLLHAQGVLGVSVHPRRQAQTALHARLPQGVRQDDRDQEVLRPRTAQGPRSGYRGGLRIRREQGAQPRADRRAQDRAARTGSRREL